MAHQIISGLYLIVMFLSIPCIAAVIGYAAWNGKPKSFDRHSYVLGFVATMLVSIIFLSFATSMHADIRTWHYAVEIACFTLGAITFGVSSGLMIGIFVYRPQE